MDIRGRVAVVTGAASGIGRSTARALHARGARVHLADVQTEALGEVADELGATGHVVDVSDPAAVQRLAERVLDAEGRVDILHNNAGIGVGKPVQAMRLEDWQRVLDINLRGVVHGVHFFSPAMLERGEGIIVNTASILGLVGVPNSAAYCTSKFGVMGLSESLDAELAPQGVRVLAICPGLIDTNIVAAGDVNMPGKTQAEVEARWKKGASPDVIAAAVVRAIERETARSVVPWDAKVLHLLRLLPTSLRHRLLQRGKKEL
ncbi:MAG: SDR family NAD(P)-dependent oxidoreductase [Deltaproteobacteria bacterium]|nr:MAG: SDR family NAD(P)-dependent oxidoreductase [Deltaproteobacteria bacterium]